MSYIPNYDTFLNSSNMSVEPVTISNNTIENYENNAKAMGVDIVYDINGNKIGYEKNVSVTDFENGEYVEKTVKIPLYASKNPNSTSDNLIIDYKPYPSYTATDLDKYEEGSVSFVMDKNEYFKEVMANSGYDVNLDEINTELLNSMWEHLNDDITHKNGIINDPIARSIFGTAGIDPSMFNSDSMAYGRLKLDDFGLKYLHDEDGVAAVLKAAAAVGMTTVNDIIDDDDETKDFFRWHVHDGDYVTLKSPNKHGDSFDDEWFASFIRPMLYENLYHIDEQYPDDESFLTYYTTGSGEASVPDYPLIANVLDDDVYQAVNKHINFWLASFGPPADGGNIWIVGTAFYGFYLDESTSNAEVINNYPERGYAVLQTYGTHYYPNSNNNWRRGYVYTKGTSNIRWQSVGQGYDYWRTFILVYSYDDFMAYMNELILAGRISDYQSLANSWFIFANCHRGSNIPGITKNANAITITANDTVADIKLKMQQQRPDWYDNSVTINEYNIYNNTTNPVTYLPIGGGDSPQTTPITRETVEKASVFNYNYTYNQVPTNPSPLPDEGPTHGLLKSNKFWSVYSPTNAQLDMLGEQLWNQAIIDILKQAFVNPTDGIICLQQIYVSVPPTKSAEICLGAYNTHIEAMLVEDFKVELNCGIAKVPRYYNDVRDFTETGVNIYLPFIGFRELDPKDVIGGAISLKYRIDILTGTCVAFISPLKKEANDSVLDTNLTTCSYMYEGNCAVQLPITAADRTRVLSGMLGGSASGIYAGGKIAGPHGAVVGGIAGTIVGGLANMQRNVYRSGNIGANAGALAYSMKPYILVDRMKPADAYQYPKFYGKPNNETIALELCSGFTRVKNVVFNTINASEYEKAEIDKLLKEGIII